MCPEMKGCRHWGLNEKKAAFECLKPQRALCPADEEEEEDDVDDEDDAVPELNFSDEGGFWV